MQDFKNLPFDVHVAILEQVDFKSLPAAIMALAQLYASAALLGLPQSTPLLRKAILLEHFGKLWLAIMCRHCVDDIENPGESKTDAMVHIANRSAYFTKHKRKLEMEYEALRTTTKKEAVSWFYQKALELELGRVFINSNFAALLFKPFAQSGKHFVNLRDRLLGFSALGRLSQVVSLLSKVPKEHKRKWFTEACYFAVHYGEEGVAKCLLQEGVDLGLTWLDPYPVAISQVESLSELACHNGQLAIARHLAAQIMLEEKDARYLQKELYCASKNGHLDVVQMLLSYGVPINVNSSWYVNALHGSCEHGHLAVAQLLMSHGSDINAENLGGTALHLACDGGHLEIAQYLILKGAHVNLQDDDTGDTPLHLACRAGHLEIAQYLILKGANVKVQNNNGETPLQLACSLGRFEMIQAFLNAYTMRYKAWGASKLEHCCLFLAQSARDQKRKLPLTLQNTMDALLKSAMRVGPIPLVSVLGVLSVWCAQVYINITTTPSVRVARPWFDISIK